MVQLQLYIEGKEVEMFSDESFTLTQTLQDVRDISKVFTDFSRTFSVPASKLNNKVFKHFYNFNIVGFDARNKKDATILINYKPFKEGKIKLEGVILKNNKPHTYKITFYGNTVNLKDLIGDDKLSALVNLEYFNFDYTDANIQSYMQGGQTTNFFEDEIESAVIFPLITVSKRLINDTAAANTDDIKNINPNSSNSNKGVSVSEFKPAIRIYTIIKAIELQYPELTFSKDFFNQTNTSFYDIYIWLHNKEGRLFIDQDAQFPVSGFQILEQSGFITGFGSASFKSKFNESKFKRELRINVVPTGTGSYNVLIKKDGEDFQRYDNLTGTTTNGVGSNPDNLEISNGTYTFFIETQTSSNFEVNVRIEQKETGFSGLLTAKKNVLYRGSASFATDKIVNIPSLMPDMKIIDFITGLFKLFNLTAFQNKDKIIEVKTLDDFYDSSKVIWNITKHLDKTENAIDAVLPFKEIHFDYESTKSFIANNHKELANKEWGSEHYKDGEKFDGKIYTIKVPFEHFKYERLYVTTNGVIQTTTTSSGDEKNTVSNIQYGYSVSENQSPYLGKALLFYAGAYFSNVAIIGLDGSTVSTVTAVKMPLNSTQASIFGFDSQSLNFSSEINEFSRLPNNITLFKTYYEKYIKDLMDSRKRLTTIKAFLPMKMLHNLNLADRIILFDNMYRINKITTDFSTNQSTIELTNIFEELKFNTLLTVAMQGITIDLTSIFADNLFLTTDGDGATDGFTIPDITTEVPNTIPPNNPLPVFDEEVVSVTPPTITSAVAPVSSSTELSMRFNVTALGKLINTPQIDEYGFFYSTDETKLESSDVDVLKAIAGVTNVPYTTLPQTKYQLPNTVSYRVTGLSYPNTIFYKFYGRTNTNSLFPTADAVSNLFNNETTISVTVALNAIVYTTSENFSSGQANTYGNAACGVNYSTQPNIYTLAHTGGSGLPTAGALLREDKDNGVNSGKSFSGGTLSFSYPLSNTTNFLAYAILNANNFATNIIIVDVHTCQVKEVYNCP